MIKYDLHSHTTFSDGRLSVAELLERATEKGVDVLAITDHDTTAAITPARHYIKEHALNLELISGVEISTKWQSFEIHIVGLSVDIANPKLTALLQTQQAKREARAKEIGQRLAKRGYEGIYDRAKELAASAEITRAHFAAALVERGVAKDIQGVFKKFLARNKTGYVPSQWCDMATAIDAIKTAGGVSVLAHPARYQMSSKWLRKLLNEFKSVGGQAMEVAQPQQAPCERQFLGQLSQEYGLLASQGSDFHYPMPWLELGKNLYLPKDCQGVWQFWQTDEERLQ
ncbi:PHP domain-containing protein [Pseudoalteromonas sp. JBTF-M23]|uniref:PHP domain-containing protein n=1 Tax=Pseudoalteromonas caenipelagi TaxID=2726988 RepID=A0A849VBI6_9GAMM|nr:PHP domain-containing protein [Pseudoalteromonas caenipelagi]NOU50999.1 PHP domain-containing protein [Pseudoalteromonas caenipelagi]